MVCTLVRAGNWIIGIIRDLRPSDHMSPLSADFGACGNGDDFGGDGGYEARIAFDGCACHVVDWL